LTSLGLEVEIGDVYLVLGGWIVRASEGVRRAKLLSFGRCSEAGPAHVDLAEGLEVMRCRETGAMCGADHGITIRASYKLAPRSQITSSTSAQLSAPPRAALTGAGFTFLYCEERDLRPTPATLTAAPRTTMSEARVMRAAGEDILGLVVNEVFCGW